MIINQSIQKYTGVWVILTFLTAYVLSNLFVDLFITNRTLGWFWDINRSWIKYVLAYSPIIYAALYILIFSLQKRETNLFISKIHLVIIAICEILYHFIEFDIRVLLSFSAISIIIFFTNIYVSLSSQNDKN